MIDMKIENIDNKIIIYLYKEKIPNTTSLLKENVKNLFVNLIRKYHLNLFGYAKVTIYQNDQYGCILEIDKLYNDLDINIIDLQLIVHKNVDFYLEISDALYFDDFKDVICKNNKFYVDINCLDNLLKYIECGKIIYNDF